VRAGFLIIFGVSAFAQQQSFEAASVKPSPKTNCCMDFKISPGGRLKVQGWPLSMIMQKAYSVEDFQILGGPQWIRDTRFDIVAKAEGNPSDAAVLEMLRSLLAEQFKLEVRREAKEGTVFTLGVERSGPKLGAPTAGAYSGIGVRVTVPPGDPIPVYIFEGQNASMSMLAQKLSVALKRPVRDQTGLAGTFDFQVEFAADDSHLDLALPVFTALKDSLGLKLEARKRSMDAIVIDHVEKP
jgi:uncharacterized protein (TIGR03435 family)